MSVMFALMSDESYDLILVILGAIAASAIFVASLLVVLLVIWLAYFLLSLPMRRQERARLFLDLLETALRQNRSVEQAIVEIALSRDLTPGVRFHLLAAHIEEGARLGQALEKVPRFLPPQVTAMLRVGEELGDLRKVLPACRALLNDAQSNVRGAESYLIVVAFALSPVAVSVFNLLARNVLPQFRLIITEMAGETPPFFAMAMAVWRWLAFLQIWFFILLLIAALLYVGGPRFVKWFRWRSLPFADWIAWRVPWKRNRMRRNFSAMLAVLLDGGVPEAKALQLAGDCAVNEIFRRRVALAGAALARGVKLTEAVGVLDDRGEFRWRLTNAVHAHGGFLRALTGWHESLDARAFQQEQAAAHVVTSALVLFNGCIVALAAMAVFGALVAILDSGLLW